MLKAVATMPAMGQDFVRWAELTDAYALQLAAMERGEPSARANAARLARQLSSILAPRPDAAIQRRPQQGL